MQFLRGRVMAVTPPPGLRKPGARLLGGAGDDLTRPGALIEEAVTDLTRCGSAPDLYVASRSREVPEQFAHDEGARNQTRFARDCILFSAIAAEAYVNAFLAESGLMETDLDALDRLPVVEKYVTGVAKAEGEVVFDHGSAPMHALSRLIDARDALCIAHS